MSSARAPRSTDAERSPSAWSWRRRRLETRRRSRARVVARAHQELSEPRRARDPLARPRRTPWYRWGKLALFVVMGLAIHGCLVVVFSLTSWIAFHPDPVPTASTERVEIRFTPPPPPPAPIAKPTVPVRPQTPKPVAKRPPPDPVNLEPKTPPPSKSRRRIIGLSFESTVTGGSGPSFAVGNTRMGETAAVAVAPESIDRLAPSRGLNRVATRVPTRGVSFEKPKRLGLVKPTYPEILRAQGLEADVVVLVAIDSAGRVTGVDVLKGSPYREFDAAARSAAMAESFAPARRGDEPVAYSLKYTYRFRLDDV